MSDKRKRFMHLVNSIRSIVLYSILIFKYSFRYRNTVINLLLSCTNVKSHCQIVFIIIPFNLLVRTVLSLVYVCIFLYTIFPNTIGTTLSLFYIHVHKKELSFKESCPRGRNNGRRTTISSMEIVL